MGKAKADKNDNDAARKRNDEGEDEHSEKRETSEDQSDIELTPVRPKIGESKDQLRKRSDYFQKRRS